MYQLIFLGHSGTAETNYKNNIDIMSPYKVVMQDMSVRKLFVHLKSNIHIPFSSGLVFTNSWENYLSLQLLNATLCSPASL